VTWPQAVDKLSRMFKGFLLTGILLCSAAYSVAQDSSSPTTSVAANPELAEISVQQDVEYAVHGKEKLLLDVYLPAGPTTEPRPAVVLIHGGAWSSLDKGTMTNMAAFLARFGFVAVSVNYRLLHGSENLWPAQLDDVQRAVRWLRSNSAKYSIDASHIGAFGHSAGAQLAALLGMEDTRDNSDAALAKYSSRVQAVVDVSGPVDFPAYHYDDNDGGLVNLLGGDYDKIPQVWRDASPVFHVAKSNAPFLIVHGTSDDAVPIAQAQELHDKLQKVGVPVSFIRLDGGHTFETPEARLRLATETLTFFNHYLVVSP
jgi:acetyl esterase/lipase